MILKIVKYPEPVLSQPGEPVTEFNDELHKAGKSDTQIAKPDVKPAESTVARTDNQSAPSATATTPQTTAVVTPGDKADQV